MKKKVAEKINYIECIFKCKYADLIAIAILFFTLTIPFYRIAFLKYEPPASDVIQWRTAAEVQLNYTEEHGEQSLWNSNLFSGMPGYMITYDGVVPHIGTFLQWIAKFTVHWSFLYLFFAGLGVYILMLSLGANKLTALIAGISFAYSCHFIGLIEIGHNTKLRAITYIPWIFWSINSIFKEKTILAVSGTALFIFSQLRENHVQISYYTAILIIIYLIYRFIWSLKDYRLKEFAVSLALLAIAFTLAVLTVAQPYLPVREYTEYTIRGGAQALDFDYATSWSFHPLEMFSFIIPYFFGGVSPTYWGWMPFTQTSFYMGILIFVLALIAVIKGKNRLILVLMTASIISLIFSFGKHFRVFTEFLLNYLPLYNKFRVPAMILVILQFSIVILAGLGLSLIIKKREKKDEFFEKFFKFGIFVSIALIVLILLSSTFIRDLELLRPNEVERFSPYQLDFLKNARADYIIRDGITSFSLLLVFFLFAYLYSKSKIKKYSLLFIVLALTTTDLILVNTRFLNDLYKRDQILEPYLTKSETDEFLLSDQELFRIFPLSNQFSQSSWAVYHQTIGGYSGAKLRRYQDILDYCLHSELQHRVPINWNIVNMLNVKYVIFQDRLPFSNLSYAFYDRDTRMVTHSNETYLPRAWFVHDAEVIRTPEFIFRRLNSQNFNPAMTVILENEVEMFSLPAESSITITDYSLHRIELDVETDVNSFLVLSEIYYPAGWKAYLNSKEIPIHPANYILRGVEIPEGNHKLEFIFHPELHYLSRTVSIGGFVLLMVLLIAGVIIYFKKNYRGEIEYIVK